MKLLDMKGYDPTLIEDPAPFTVEINRYQNYGELLKNSVESYPLRDKMVPHGKRLKINFERLL
ncbi:MAG: hypothetical protein J5U19_14225 [Candidatus Methanoperedens sp.]|nr:hypothetical protein [Candidatus Methanoperedens sp.]